MVGILKGRAVDFNWILGKLLQMESGGPLAGSPH